MDTREKIVTTAEMEQRRSAADASVTLPVVAKGRFDILQPEHSRRLSEARAPGGQLVVIVYADGDPPSTVLDQRTRAELAAGLEAADVVVICDEAEADQAARSWGARKVVDIDRPALPDLVDQVLGRQRSDGITP